MEGVANIFFSDRFCIYRNVVAAIGTVYILYCVCRMICTLFGNFRAYVLAPCGISTLDLTKYGSWSVITGGSEGIGRGYALEMARRGLNVVILSRSQEKLSKVEEEIKNKYNREVRIIPVDFSEGQVVYEDIETKLNDLDIAVLVNNVGLSIECPDYFVEINKERYRNIIELNCQATVQMTHLILPKMIQKGKGIIINISSIACAQPTPLLNIYSATKEFVKYFSTALQTEYEAKGIIVQCVYPGFVATAMSGIRRAKWWAPDPVKYSRSAVATIGIQQHTNGCIPHTIQAYISEMIPSGIYQKLTLSTLSKAKEAYIKRKAKKQ